MADLLIPYNATAADIRRLSSDWLLRATGGIQFWQGPLGDHIYESCPALNASKAKRPGFGPLGDPYDSTVCGICQNVYRRRTANVINDFWAKVDKDGPNGCWLWTGPSSRTVSGRYGKLNVRPQKSLHAHRLSYYLLKGDIPKGYQLDHLCRVTLCVNPDHLEAVTQRENVLRGDGYTGKNARKTHCVNGHEFTPENTYHRPDRPESRGCKECGRERRQRRSEDESA